MPIHALLQTIKYHAACLVTVHILSGTYYVSSFFGVSHQAAVRSFCKNAKFVCQNDSPAVFKQTADSLLQFEFLSLLACAKFGACVYYDQHKTVFGSQTAYELCLSIREPPVPHETALILQWLGYANTPDIKISTVQEWVDLVRGISFYDSSGGQHHEEKVMPSLTALHQHILRAQYVARLAYESPFYTSTFADCCGCGWSFSEEGAISVVWDIVDEVKLASMIDISSHKYSCRTECAGSHGGCRSCFRNCRPCTVHCSLSQQRQLSEPS